MRIDFGSWSLERHLQWEADQDGDYLTLTRTDDGGAFQLSSGRKSHGSVTDEDLDWCIQRYMTGLKGEWSIPAPVVLGEFSGKHTAATIDGTFWSWWILGCGPVLLRASYNGPSTFVDAELPHVESMLGTLVSA